ncbi:MAG: putative holin-like toxin [Candidatus Alkaliphilus sp. MAG34]
MKAFEAFTLVISSNMLLISLISLIVMLTKDNIKRKK